jgi:hypothetical protein
MSDLKIIPLSTGRFLEAEKSMFTYAVDQGVKIQSPILMWFIDGAQHKILVDTGVSDPEWAARYHHPIERKTHEDPINAIEALGLKASDIDIIVNTHLHWDHCFNNHLFPNARILVQAEELRYAISPLPCHAQYYESQLISMTPSWLKALDRIEVVEGEMEIERRWTASRLSKGKWRLKKASLYCRCRATPTVFRELSWICRAVAASSPAIRAPCMRTGRATTRQPISLRESMSTSGTITVL